MLEVKILKLRHMGREPAVKLRPHIKECDIFSSEAAGLSEQGADNFEKQWSSLLTLSRTEFRKRLISPDNEYMAFIRELQEGLHYEKKPVHILERFSETDSAMITTIARRFIGPYSLNFLERATRGEEEPLRVLRSNLSDYLQSLLLRDQEIGRNLTIAESEIRRKVPSLSSKDKIRLAVCIGKYHYPEKYTDIKTQTIEVPTEETRTDVLIRRLYQSGDLSNVSDKDVKLFAEYTLNNKY